LNIATAWWIRASDGAIEPVLKHDLWLRNYQNLRRWNLEHLFMEISNLKCSQEDEIRMIGIRVGLIRVRETNGEYSVQFAASKIQLMHYLQVILISLNPMMGPLSIVRLGNLHEECVGSIRMSWTIFEIKMKTLSPTDGLWNELFDEVR
jgi:hypothetical protein